MVEKVLWEALRAEMDGVAFLRHLEQIPSGRKAELTVAIFV